MYFDDVPTLLEAISVGLNCSTSKVQAVGKLHDDVTHEYMDSRWCAMRLGIMKVNSPRKNIRGSYRQREPCQI